MAKIWGGFLAIPQVIKAPTLVVD
ncbi:hypothetical protein CCACVL1_19003 [Corchorus capsularis]|uniref:Uncharacterized protein n=1 Tax=Corchorus capsularis TaxID=210143 RepID=A0A1R3HJ17_COCAP|nr:hypothetical protein CCACVL1_19003 [Corchorus capsularis]